MRVFEQLNSNEAVELDGGKYLVAFATGTYETSHGVQFRSTGGWNSGGSQVVLDRIDDIVQVTEIAPKLISYVDETGAEAPSVEEVAKTLKEYNYYMYDGDSGGFPNLDEEFEYRRKIVYHQTLTKVMSEKEIIKTPIEIKVVGKFEDTGSDFITSSYSIGKIGFYSSGPYRVLSSAVAVDEFKKLQKNDPRLINQNTGIQFAKYGASYIFYGDKQKNSFIEADKMVVVKTLEAAREHEKNIRDYVRASVNLVRNPRDLADVDKTYFANELITALRSAKSNVAAIESKSKTTSSRYTAINQIDEIITRIINLHKD